jgi:hypothetical protein
MHHQGPNQTPDASPEPDAGSQPSAACSPWIPESKLRPVPKNSTNSFVRKILLANPLFPRFYADVVLAARPNSHEARILRTHYSKILAKVNPTMSTQSCTHIKVSGVRCDSPAMRGEQFCYFHQNAHRGVRRPPQSRLHPIALIEDEESIQYALMEVINALMRNTIDYKRANLIIRALHIAAKNASRVRYGFQGKYGVKQVPDYAEPTAEHEAAARECELPAVAEIPYKPVAPGDPHYWEWQYEGQRVLKREAQARAEAAAHATAHGETAASAVQAQAQPSAAANVGADAPVRPAPMSEAKGRVPEAESSKKPESISSAPTKLAPHNFRNESKPQQKSATTNPTQRKPPVPMPKAPQERKTTAHRASGG